MGQSICIEGVKPPDGKWKKMKGAYDACVSAGIDVPIEVLRFFGHSPPLDPLGVVLSLNCGGIDAIEKLNEEMKDGFVVDLKKLDPDIRYLRFYVSY